MSLTVLFLYYFIFKANASAIHKLFRLCLGLYIVLLCVVLYARLLCT